MPKYKPIFKTGDKIKLKDGLPRDIHGISPHLENSFRKTFGDKFEVLAPDRKGKGGLDLEVKVNGEDVTLICDPRWFELDKN